MVDNEAERRRWNDQRWTDLWPDRELLTSAISPVLLQALELQAGERVLDVGCGGGGTTIACAEAVGPEGFVIGADISVALTALAAARAQAVTADNTSFQVVDAQGDDIGGGPFDVATSQFGVMFFDQPVTAFANIRRHLHPGGRLVFACWQPVTGNPWHIGTAPRAPVPPTPTPAPGKRPTGPFVLGDPDQTKAILEDAGFVDVHHTLYDISIEAPARAIVDESQLDFMGIAAADLAAARALVADHLAQFHRGPDLYCFPLAFIIFEAVSR